MSGILTIGHSDHASADFCGHLLGHRVEVLCDVRSSPYSCYHGQFNREILKASLASCGVRYLFMGDLLGARVTDPACFDGERYHHDLIRTRDFFKKGIDRLREEIERYTVAVMCAEKDPITCHRMILVTRCLKACGVEIGHIDYDGELESNAAAERRLLEAVGVEPNMFMADGERLDRAYRLQGEKIAYRGEARKRGISG